METQPTRSQLKKKFLSGLITSEEFHSQLELTLRYRGYHSKLGQNPQWSGPFHSEKSQADADNSPWFNLGYQIGIYTEQG